MTLGELITVLESADQSYVVPMGFAYPDSYRGMYECLAFEPVSEITVSSMLEAARSALGATYEGYKGGTYTMHEYTDVYLAYYGHVGEEIGPVLLSYMLGNPQVPEEGK